MKKEKVCHDALHFICENLDEDLNSPRCSDIKAHIEKCTDCAAYLKSLKTTVALYRIYPPPEIPDATRTRIDESIKTLFSKK